MKIGRNQFRMAIGRQLIKEVSLGLKSVWQAIRSCFGAGYWRGDKPWRGDDAWKG